MTGTFSAMRGGLSAIAVTYRASDSLVDVDNTDLITFQPDDSITTGDLGFFSTHINVEPGDEVYIGKTTTGSGNTLNATFAKHRVFSVAQDRIALSSPVVVPVEDRSTATELTEINDAVLFFI